MRVSHKRNIRSSREKDLDQIDRAMKDPKVKHDLLNQPIDENLPGLGQFYCVECAKYFEDDLALKGHAKGSKHKKRVKLLKEVPYTQEEAEFAAGIMSAKSITATRPQAGSNEMVQ